jgi:hypothetical protein
MCLPIARSKRSECNEIQDKAKENKRKQDNKKTQQDKNRTKEDRYDTAMLKNRKEEHTASLGTF